MVEYTMQCMNTPNSCPQVRVQTLPIEAPAPDTCSICGGPAQVTMIQVVGG